MRFWDEEAMRDEPNPSFCLCLHILDTKGERREMNVKRVSSLGHYDYTSYIGESGY
jgi:hypothetical protein